MGLASAHNSDRNSHLLGQSLVVSTGVLKHTLRFAALLSLSLVGLLVASDQCPLSAVFFSSQAMI